VASSSSLTPDDPGTDREPDHQDRDEVADRGEAALFGHVEHGGLVVFLGALVHLLVERQVFENEQDNAYAETDQGALECGMHGGDYSLGTGALPCARRAKRPRLAPRGSPGRLPPPPGRRPIREAAARR